MTHAYRPYEPPQSLISDPGLGSDGFVEATRMRRFANVMLDSVVFQLVAAPVYVVFELAAPGSTEPLLASYALASACMFAYYVVFESFGGRTPGKMITGTRVTGLAGESPTLRAVALRSLIRMIPFEPISFLGGMEPRGWHDQWSETRVVYTRGRSPKNQ